MKYRVSAGAFVRDGERLLLVRHRKQGSYDFWVTPGGGVRHAEELEAAAQREVLEETGLEVLVSSLLYIEEFYSSKTRYCKFWFAASAVGGTLSVAAPEAKSEHIVAAEWLTQADLQKREVYPAVLREQYWQDQRAGITAPRRLPLHAMEQ